MTSTTKNANAQGPAWWHRHLMPEVRRQVMNDLAISRVEHWAMRFTIMLTLSVFVAVMGLALNSPAVVIGAMLLAPLMQPVLATGASLSMTNFGLSLRSFAKVAAATAWCIVIAYVLSKLLPEQELTPEIEARTKPDIRDLVVALAAGAAGAYATVREDASASLPGVAVAVALVPPLASSGIALEAAEYSKAWGALLLYFTNLSAIVFASIAVFVATGFVPSRRLANNFRGLGLTTFFLAALVSAIALPLYRASAQVIERNEADATAAAAVESWLGAGIELDTAVSFDKANNLVVVELQGPDTPPDQGRLEQSLQKDFPGSQVLVEWIQVERVTRTTTPKIEPSELLRSQAEAVTQEWLESSGDDYQLDQVLLKDNYVRIDAAGTGEPPDLEKLSEQLQTIDTDLIPRLNWTQRKTIIPGADLRAPLEIERTDMREAVEVWALQNGFTVTRFDHERTETNIDLSGTQAPTDFSELEAQLKELASNEDLNLSVYFTQRQLLTTTTSAATTTTTGP